ncbi:MAG: CDP-diacylglycerol--serine O-phosphatidyltransferase [Magnetospiraceae bacterium]
MATFRTRRPRPKRLPINRLIPNMLTMGALSAGLTAIYFGLQDRWDAAVWAIMIAAVLDALDGRIARMLKGTSKFGAELDSLSDIVSFGVAPAMVNFLWSLQDTGKAWGWMIALIFVVCCALRLARFNTALDKPDLPPWAYNFFTGVPAPAAAGLSLIPLGLYLSLDLEPLSHPLFVAAVMVGIAAMMVSRFPTFSFKRVSIPQDYVLLALLAVGLMVALLVAAPWLTLSVVGIVYVISFVFSWRAYKFLEHRADMLQRHVRHGEALEDDAPTDAPPASTDTDTDTAP